VKIHFSYIQRFFIFLLIFFSSASSVLAKNDYLFLAFFLILTTVHLFLGTYKDYLKMSSILFFIVIVVSYYSYINPSSSFYSWLGWGLRILFAFLVVRINKANFVPNFIKVVHFIAIVSLFGYVLQLIFPSLLFQIGTLINIGTREGIKKIASFIIFNFSIQHSLRNSGCMWEPGVYGSILNIALLFLSIPNYTYYSKKKYIIIVLAIITTFSTDAYLALAILIFYSNLKIKSIYKKLFNFIVFIPILFLTFLNTDFLSDKISNQFKGIDTQVYKASKYDKMVLSRFSSMVIDFPVFLKRPLLGYGIDLEEVNGSFLYKDYDQNVDRTYGGFTMLLYFGLIGFILYFGAIYLQIFKLSFDTTYSLFSVITIFILLYSNPLPYSPILFSLFFLYKRSEQIRENIINNS